MISRSLDIYKTIFNAAPDGLLVVNEAGIILMANAQVKKIFGYESSEIIGKEIEILVPGNFAVRHRAFRVNYNANPRRREMGSGQSLLARG